MKIVVETAGAGDAVAPAGVRAQRRDATRQRIIDAAIDLFAGRGFDGTALPAIASACGVAVPLMIYHFKTKEALWQAAVAEIFAQVAAHIAGFQQQIDAAAGADFYRICARAHITALARHPQYMRIMFQEGTQASDRLTWLVETHQNRMTATLMAIIDRAQTEGVVPAMDLAHAKFIFSGAFCLPIVLGPEYRLVTGEDSATDAFIERHIDACLRLLLLTVDWGRAPVASA
jgi:TetR/AcrR family transcriptional regulator